MSPDDKRRSGGDTVPVGVGVGGLGVSELDVLTYHPAGFSFLACQRPTSRWSVCEHQF